MARRLFAHIRWLVLGCTAVVILYAWAGPQIERLIAMDRTEQALASPYSEAASANYVTASKQLSNPNGRVEASEEPHLGNELVAGQTGLAAPQSSEPRWSQRWLQSHRTAAVFVDPAETSQRFGLVAAGSYVVQLDSQAGWRFVKYLANGNGETAVTAWIPQDDVAPIDELPTWVRNDHTTVLRRVEGVESEVPGWSWLELTGDEQDGLLPVRFPGDGQFGTPGAGWIAAQTVVPVPAPLDDALPRGYPTTMRSDLVRLQVPYRSQLDGTAWESANCGPTTLGMALDALGLGGEISSAQLRREVLDAQELWGDDAGTFLEALAKVGTRYGARVSELYRDGRLMKWALDDIRRQVSAGRPVIVQVRFRALLGRSDSPYFGDHYIVITGFTDDRFLYNDSIDSDGIGYDRLIHATELERAMNASDRRYAYAGFALSRP